MDGNELTKETFLDNVKDHTLNIIKDDGLYRHIRCKKANGSSDMFFDIITWPGNLAYTGDMGSYMFSRVEDMFRFFRNDKLEINTGYWAEKVMAESIFGNGIREFSVVAFRENVLNHVKDCLELDEGQKIPDEIMDEIYGLLNAEDEYECVEEIRNFNSEKVSFDDFWECSPKRKTWHYIWCCYAIVWAIMKYDELKGQKP